MTRDKARALRALIEKAAAGLGDGDALDGVELFPAWAAVANYAIADRVRYEGRLYKCVQAHASQTGWEPPNVPALWTEVAAPGEIPVWRQPTGAQDAYNIGDKVWYPERDTVVYVSLINGNVWSPDAYPAGWEVAT